MRKASVLAIALIFTLINVSAQTKSDSLFTVKGVVVDSVSAETVPYCTISASLEKTPTNYFKRIAADVNGKFAIELNKKDTVLLHFDAMGMQYVTKKIVFTGDKNLDIGKVLLKEGDKVLSEVVITASKPLVKVDLDKIIYDTKSDPESATSSTFDILRKVPMITIDSEDKIEVKGKSNYKIFMNGKPSNLTSSNPSEILKTLPASTIKNIEVITEPGVKYESEGLSGIINIVTEKAIVGYNATLNAGVDSRGGYNGGIYFTTKIGKLGVSTSLNYGNRRSPKSINDNIRRSLLTEDVLYQNSTYDGKNSNRYGNLELSYEIDSLNLITLSGGTWGGGYSNTGESYSRQLDKTQQETQRFTQIYRNEGAYGGYDGSLNYQRSFKKPDKLFTLSYQLSAYPNKNESWNDIIGELNYFSRNQHTKSNSYSSEHTFQADYTEPFNKKHVVELGAKYILRINGSENIFEILDENTQVWKPQPAFSDDMEQRQGVLGAYGSYTYKLDKWSVRGGVRLEATHTDIDFKTNPEKNFDVPNFFNLVPDLNINYKINDAQNIRLGYNQRLSRPGIWYLNPFYNNSDPVNVRQGNPNLKTEISNSFSLGYNYISSKFNLSANLSSSFTNNSIENTSELRTYPNGTTYQYSTFANIGMSNWNSLYTYIRWQINPKLNFYTNLNVSYTYYKSGIAEIGNRDGWRYGTSFGGNYTLPWDLRLNFNGNYNSPWVMLQGRGAPFYYYGMSLTKRLLNNKLNVSLRANEFFEKYKSNSGYTETASFRSDYVRKYPARYLGISVSYSFGEMKADIKKARRGISNDDVKSGGGE